jgi:hypothetical protein
MTEDEIATITFLVDEFIGETSDRADINPLMLCSIILARITLANDYAGSGDEFRKLLKHVSSLPVPGPTKQEVH